MYDFTATAAIYIRKPRLDCRDGEAQETARSKKNGAACPTTDFVAVKCQVVFGPVVGAGRLGKTRLLPATCL